MRPPSQTTSRGRVESVRRACRRLVAEGHAELDRVYRPSSVLFRRDGHWHTRQDHRWFLAVRPALTDAERAAEQAEKAQAQRESRAMLAILRG